MTDVLLGRDIITNTKITIGERERLTGMYVIGANGTGKSTLLENLIIQDIENGFGVGLLDPHGDLTNAVLMRIPDNRLADVILLDPLDVEFPFGLNIMACDKPNDPIAVEHAVEQIVQIFSKVFGMSVETPRLNQYIRNIAYTLIGTPYTMVEIPNLLLDRDFRARVLASSGQGNSKLFWKSFDALRPTEQLDRSESTLDRIDSLISNSIIRNIVGQSETTINFREIMDSGKILLVQLAARYESLTSLLGSIIIGQLLTASLSRATTNKRRQFNLYADEYQRFATPDFSTLLTEARKFGVATTIAHQVRAQLDEKNAATALQAGSLVVFRVTPEDAEELAPAFNLAPPIAIKPPGTTPADILNHLTDHPSEDVKLFWSMFVKKLLEAKTMQTDTPLRKFYSVADELPYPYFLIKNERVYFDPEIGRQLLEYLQQLFYNSSINKGSNADLLKEALLRTFEMVTHPGFIGREQFYNLFADKLKLALYAVYKQPIEVNTTEWQDTLITQQTYSDRANQRANELVGLPIGMARLKLPNGEYLIKTILPQTPKTERAKLAQKKIQVVEQTREKYCKTRAEVEEEIRKRQTDDGTPSTQRKHTM